LLNLRSWVRDSLCGLWLEKRLNDERWLLLKSAASRSVFASENIQPPDAGRFASETRDFRAPVKVRLARALTLGLRIPMVLERQNSQRPLDRRPPKSAFARGNNLHQPASRHPAHQTHVHVLAAWCARVVQLHPPDRGRGECRAPTAPAASRAKW